MHNEQDSCYLSKILALCVLAFPPLVHAGSSDPVALTQAEGFKGCDTAIRLAFSRFSSDANKNLSLVAISQPNFSANEITLRGAYESYGEPNYVQASIAKHDKECLVSLIDESVESSPCSQVLGWFSGSKYTHITMLNTTMFAQKVYEKNGREVLNKQDFLILTPVTAYSCLRQLQQFSHASLDE